MNAGPKVSVVIPVYNRARYVAAAVESVLAQSFTDFELLLINDGSTDGSAEILRSYSDPRVRLVCNQSNLGIPQTRNMGLRLACGEYLAWLDSDDVAYRDRLNAQVAFLDRHQDYAAVGSWTMAMDERGRRLTGLGLFPISPEEVQSQLLFHCSLANSSVMARTAILQEYGYCEQWAVCTDFDLWVRVAGKYKLGNLPRVLVRRRMHSGRITQEQAQLVKEAKLEIFRAQLVALGMTYSPADVERHFLLLHLRASQRPTDREYLVWAETWLQGLRAANQRTRCYPEPAFACVVSEMWVAVCWQAAAGLGWAAWKHFWQSPLSKTVWSSARKYGFLLVFRGEGIFLPRPARESVGVKA